MSLDNKSNQTKSTIQTGPTQQFHPRTIKFSQHLTPTSPSPSQITLTPDYNFYYLSLNKSILTRPIPHLRSDNNWWIGLWPMGAGPVTLVGPDPLLRPCVPDVGSTKCKNGPISHRERLLPWFLVKRRVAFVDHHFLRLLH